MVEALCCPACPVLSAQCSVLSAQCSVLNAQCSVLSAHPFAFPPAAAPQGVTEEQDTDGTNQSQLQKNISKGIIRWSLGKLPWNDIWADQDREQAAEIAFSTTLFLSPAISLSPCLSTSSVYSHIGKGRGSQDVSWTGWPVCQSAACWTRTRSSPVRARAPPPSLLLRLEPLIFFSKMFECRMDHENEIREGSPPMPKRRTRMLYFIDIDRSKAFWKRGGQKTETPKKNLLGSLYLCHENVWLTHLLRNIGVRSV